MQRTDPTPSIDWPDDVFRKKIPLVPPGSSRPLWSVLIPTHNCAKYLEQTLVSVLRQDPGIERMEIIVVDDHSTRDCPEEVVQRLGKGRIRFVRQERNVGKSLNYQTGLELSRGRLIHQLHGDDIVCDGFYRSMETAFEAFPDAGAFFCESEYIDANGNNRGRTGKESDQTGLLDDWLYRIAVSQRIQTPSIVVRRAVYENLGGFDTRLAYFEDWEMWVRIATAYRFGFNAETIARYRVYPENTSSQSVVSGVRARVLRETVAIIDSYLPEEILSRCKKERSLALAHYLIRCIPQAVGSGKFKAWLKLCIEIIRYSCAPRVLYYICLFTFNGLKS